MALDELLFNQVINGTIEAFFRIYSWQKPSITLGKNQKITDVNIAKCKQNNTDLTRRITGGRAVLHFNEITYSIGFKPNEEILSSRKKYFYAISSLITEGIAGLGIKTQINAKQKGEAKNPDCFKSTSLYEITDEKQNKLVGSAMCIKQNCIFQHGSIPLTSDYQKIKYFLTNEANHSKPLFEMQKGKIVEKSDKFIKAINKKINLDNYKIQTILNSDEFKKLKEKYSQL